ncbi:MAG: response regulator [Methylotenera sp.]|nr:response regulator [Methylotenera sp.]
MQKILVVDDDLVVLATISMGLRQAGYQVLQVDSGELAVQICKREDPELAILDVRMPGMSGFEVAEILRKVSKTPFIFLSAYSDEESVQSAKELGALGYVVKPVEIKRLVPAIEIALARAEDLEKLEDINSNLVVAMEGNREIDVAIGIIMQCHRLNRADAFKTLRTYARSQRCKINTVAQRVISGEDILPRC